MTNYNPKSLKAEEFINDSEIRETLTYAESNKNNITERTNKKRTLKRKVLTQIVICLIVYGIFYCINNTNSSFSNDMKQ